MKGIIALDIDGTVTSTTHGLDQEVIHSLHKLHQDGWRFIFITGRPFRWGSQTLESLPFSFAFAVQNGALLLEMPDKKILSRKPLAKELLPAMEEIGRAFQTDFVVYGGYENEDVCFYRPHFLPPSILAYVNERKTSLGETWQALQTFSHFPVDFFSSVKFFATEEQAFSISSHIENRLGLHAPPNRDPFNRHFFVIQVTHPQATKGDILKEFIELTGISAPIIAAGDDYNDRSMLNIAHVKVVMGNAPADLLRIADVIAPPASRQGIIQGLSDAIHFISKENTYAS